MFDGKLQISQLTEAKIWARATQTRHFENTIARIDPNYAPTFVLSIFFRSLSSILQQSHLSRLAADRSLWRFVAWRKMRW
jgi:hypothetical protein